MFCCGLCQEQDQSNETARWHLSAESVSNMEMDDGIRREPILTLGELNELSGYDWPFENLVIEGGGSKCYSALGTYRVFEQLGIAKNIKRFAGASAGALFCTAAAVGYDSYGMQKYLGINMKDIIEDASFGFLSVIPNMIRNFGMNEGERLHRWIGEFIARKTGDPDTTFMELYKKTGVELVITVTNIVQMDCMYCHIKTTPSMTIRKAVRMSMAIPGVMQPIVDEGQVCIDGGVLCNYPIRCFDGWYLSMKQEDSFLSRFDHVDAATSWDTDKIFDTYNEKTVGVLVYSTYEEEIFKGKLDKRKKDFVKRKDIPIFPKTEKASERSKKFKKRENALRNHSRMNRAMQRFVKALREYDTDMSGTISKQELSEVIEKGTDFTPDDAELLFGDDVVDIDEIFDKLDTDGNGEELTSFAEEKGLQLMAVYRTLQPEKIGGMGKFFEAMINTVLYHRMKDYIRERDFDRTIGLDTGYINTMDFDMTDEDKQFLIQQGKVGCLAFLRYFIQKNNMTKKTSVENGELNGNGEL